MIKMLIGEEAHEAGSDSFYKILERYKMMKFVLNKKKLLSSEQKGR